MHSISARQPFLVILFAAILLLLAKPVAADEPHPVAPIDGPRLTPNLQVADNHRIYNELIVSNLPPPARQADIDDKGRQQEEAGRGIRQINSVIGSGAELNESPRVCNDFNQATLWRSSAATAGNIWSDSYGGWTVFAYDNGDLYQQEHVTFARESVVGPGSNYGTDHYSLKIASGQPYAAGLSSPPLSVPPNARVQVRVKYLIFDHDIHGQDYDWISLTIKPDAEKQYTTPNHVNGHVRGSWAELRQQIVAEETGQIQIFIQAHSPAALNSNIYIDDVEVRVNGRYMAECLFRQ